MTYEFKNLSELIETTERNKDFNKSTILRMLQETLYKSSKSHALSETEEYKIVVKMMNECNEAARAYEDCGRKDLSELETEQAELLKGFLPEYPTDERINEIINESIKNNGVTSHKNAIIVCKDCFSNSEIYMVDRRKLTEMIFKNVDNLKYKSNKKLYKAI